MSNIPDEIKDEILHQRGLQDDHRKRLRAIERKVAKYGKNAPAEGILDMLRMTHQYFKDIMHLIERQQNVIDKIVDIVTD